MWDAFLQYLPPFPAFSLLLVTAFLGGVMRGFSGFGAGLLIAPVYVLIIPPSDVVVVILLLNLVTTLPMFREAKADVEWPLVWRIFFPSLLGIPLGLAMLHMVDPVILRRAVSCIVSLVAAFMLAGWVYRGARGRVQDGVAGALSGYLTAIGGIGGPPLVLYLLSDKSIRPTRFRAFSLIFFMLSQIATLVPMMLTGMLTRSQLAVCAALLFPYVIANQLGAFLHRKTASHREALVRRICLLFLLFIGIVTLLL